MCGWLIPWMMGWSCFPSPGAKQLFATKEYKEHKEEAEFLTADGTGWACGENNAKFPRRDATREFFFWALIPWAEATRLSSRGRAATGTRPQSLRRWLCKPRLNIPKKMRVMTRAEAVGYDRPSSGWGNRAPRRLPTGETADCQSAPHGGGARPAAAKMEETGRSRSCRLKANPATVAGGVCPKKPPGNNAHEN